MLVYRCIDKEEEKTYDYTFVMWLCTCMLFLTPY